MANLSRRMREREPGQMSRLDPFRALSDLFRWDPFADLDILPRRGEAMFWPDIDLKETPDALVLKVDLPGVRDEDIDVAVTGNRITISGRREEETREENEQYHAYERQFGTFTRTFVLPDVYDPDQVRAELKNGVLGVTVPKKPGAQAKHIPLISSRQSQAEGQRTSPATGSSSMSGSSQATGSSQISGSSQAGRGSSQPR
jgi:HSP20 family protein